MNTPDFRNYKNAEIDKTIDAAMTSQAIQWILT